MWRSPHQSLLGRRALLGGGIACAMVARAAGAAPDPDAAYDKLLRRHVAAGADGITRVAYGRWRANGTDRAALDQAIAAMSARRPSAMSRAEAYAFWANLYNAVTLKVVIDSYPVASIRDIKGSSWLDPKAYTGPWRDQRVTVEGRGLSLDDIEHAIMRPGFKDPRVHYAVNCASFGCPNLMPRAWRAETLEADLDDAARAYINHPRGVTALPSGTLRVSSIYRWFIEDFGGTDDGLRAHFRVHAAPALARTLEGAPAITDHDYDWSLNRA
jgi:hypothetical protein